MGRPPPGASATSRTRRSRASERRRTRHRGGTGHRHGCVSPATAASARPRSARPVNEASADGPLHRHLARPTTRKTAEGRSSGPFAHPMHRPGLMARRRSRPVHLAPLTGHLPRPGRLGPAPGSPRRRAARPPCAPRPGATPRCPVHLVNEVTAEGQFLGRLAHPTSGTTALRRSDGRFVHPVHRTGMTPMGRLLTIVCPTPTLSPRARLPGEIGHTRNMEANERAWTPRRPPRTVPSRA
jgi:hypothetical protein